MRRLDFVEILDLAVTVTVGLWITLNIYLNLWSLVELCVIGVYWCFLLVLMLTEHIQEKRKMERELSW